VATDASDVGVGAVLYQLPKGKEYPKCINYISFMAQSLQERERKYSATKKELLAIVFALNKFHHYLWGRSFDLFSDHRALTFLHSQQNLNSMMTTWQDTILNYTFTIHYHPGIINILPDALSRLFPPSIRNQVLIPSASDEVSLAYLHTIQNSETERKTIPLDDREIFLVHAHGMGHLGTNGMVKAIHEEGATWPNLTDECLAFVKKCGECQRVNITRKGYHPMRAIHARLPGEHIAMDLAGPFIMSKDKNVYLLILVDVCTRFVLLDALKNKSSIEVASALNRRFSTIGFPNVLQSDNGTEFVNQIVRVMTEQMNVDH
jgi:hypothetical protein